MKRDKSFSENCVLILVVVDNGLVHLLVSDIAAFNSKGVLILVVVDNGLVPQILGTPITKEMS